MLELLLAILAILAFVLTVGVVAALGYRRDWKWTGLPAEPGDATTNQPGRPARTAWDWFQLLIVPFVLALATFGLTLAQSQRDREAQRHQADLEQVTEHQRAASEERAAEDRAREDTLRTYLQQMSDLITDHDLRTRPRVYRLENTPTGTQTLARTLTLVALRQLDSKRKGIVVQFLAESELISATTTGNAPRVSLAGADLRGAVMPPSLSVVTLRFGTTPVLRVSGFDGAILRDADFSERDLSGVSFNGADLRGADFTGASIYGADYSYACVSDTRFVKADARRPNLSTSFGIYLEYTVEMSGQPHLPIRPPVFNFAEGRGVDFTKADLTGVISAHQTASTPTLRPALH